MDAETRLAYLTGKLASLLLEHGAALNGEHQIAYMGVQGAKTIHLCIDGGLMDMEIADGNNTGLQTYSEFYDEG